MWSPFKGLGHIGKTASKFDFSVQISAESVSERRGEGRVEGKVGGEEQKRSVVLNPTRGNPLCPPQWEMLGAPLGHPAHSERHQHPCLPREHRRAPPRRRR